MNGLFGEVKNGSQAAMNQVMEAYARPFNVAGGILNFMGMDGAKEMPGTSKWAKKKGLIEDVQNGFSSDVGRTMGAAIPLVIAGQKPNAQNIAKAIAMSYLTHNILNRGQ